MSRFDRAFLNQVLQRTSITEVVGQKVVWDKRKSMPSRGDMWACCPFHGEKSPSFHATESKGTYHCFGCGEHGNAFDFIMKTQNLGFSDAVEQLAHSAGMEVPKDSPQAQEKAGKSARVLEVLSAARKLFEEALLKDDGKIARAYLQKRGIAQKDWAKFGLGFSPNTSNWLKERLTQGGFLVEDLLDAGLLRAPDEGGAPYDLYRNRLMFAIEDGSGKTISFGARTLQDDVQPKYLNGPETITFSKSYTLYRYKEARVKAKNQPIIISEGYMDVIALELAGFAAVAPLGTALTTDQLTMAWRACPRPILCFDGDDAGRRAAIRALDRALPMLGIGKGLGVVLLPKGQDPDDIIKSMGKAQMTEFVENAMDFTEFLFDTEFNAEPLETAQAKAGLKSRLRAKINEIKDEDLKAEVKIEITERLNRAFGRDAKAPQQQQREQNFQPQNQNRAFRGKNAPPVVTSELREKVRKDSPAIGGLKAKMKYPPLELRNIVVAPILLPALLEKCDEAYEALNFGFESLNHIKNAVLSLHYANKPIEFSIISSQLLKHNQTESQEVIEVLKKSKLNPFVKEEYSLETSIANWLEAIEKIQEKLAIESDAAALTRQAGTDESEALKKLSQLVLERRNLNKGNQDEL